MLREVDDGVGCEAWSVDARGMMRRALRHCWRHGAKKIDTRGGMSGERGDMLRRIIGMEEMS